MNLLSEVIAAHQDALRESDVLTARQMENDRRMKEGYRLIREIMDQDGMRGVALVDENSRVVYYMNNGLLMGMKYVLSSELDLEQDKSLDDPQDIVSVGEAS